jgi:hypothetical protein
MKLAQYLLYESRYKSTSLSSLHTFVWNMTRLRSSMYVTETGTDGVLNQAHFPILPDAVCSGLFTGFDEETKLCSGHNGGTMSPCYVCYVQYSRLIMYVTRCIVAVLCMLHAV